MIQNVLRNFIGIDAYGVISLCLFVTVFTGIVIWALLRKRSYLDAMARTPLDPDEKDPDGVNDPDRVGDPSHTPHDK